MIGAPASSRARGPRALARDPLSVRVLRPTGFVAAERTERWWDSRSGGLGPDEAKKKGLSSP